MLHLARGHHTEDLSAPLGCEGPEGQSNCLQCAPGHPGNDELFQAQSVSQKMSSL